MHEKSVILANNMCAQIRSDIVFIFFIDSHETIMLLISPDHSISSHSMNLTPKAGCSSSLIEALPMLQATR